MIDKEAKKVVHIHAYPNSPNDNIGFVFEKSKLWGSEFHLHNNRQYCAKAMVVLPGGKCSVHFHKKKTETFTLCAGELIVEITNINTGISTTHHLKNAGDSITIYPETPHTFYVPENQVGPSWFVESSSEDFKDDSYRLTQSTGPTSDNR
jgi:mannose-6-phosphate isomerase-like protein (cupin superfamily)